MKGMGSMLDEDEVAVPARAPAEVDQRARAFQAVPCGLPLAARAVSQAGMSL